MSISRVRHRGERPRDIDHGPSAGARSLQGAQAAVSRLSEFSTASLAPSGGAGPIERRMATDAQREAWRVADNPPARPAIDDIPTAVPWRPAPGSVADRHAADAHAARIAIPSPEPEEPVMAIEPPLPALEPITDPAESLGIRIAVVAATAAAASDAWAELQVAAQAERAAEAALAAAEVRWDGARATLEASWRSTGMGGNLAVGSEAERRHHDLLEQAYTPPSRITEVLERRATRVVDEPALAEEVQMALEDEAVAAALRDDRLGEPVDDAPEVVTRGPERQEPASVAGGGPEVSLPRGQREVLAAVTKHRGDRRAAAAELHRTLNTVEQQLEYVGRKGLLSAELIALLPARFAKYSPAAG